MHCILLELLKSATGGVLVWNPSMGLDGISSIHKGITHKGITSALLPVYKRPKTWRDMSLET